jgi:tetratricopeptide (TPR) repeat protein
MKRQIILIIFLLNFSVSFSQQSKIDSLVQVSKTTTNDSIKVRTYLKIYYEYHRTDFNLALDYALKAEKLALEKGLNEGLGLSKYRKGNLYKALKKFQLAEKAYHEAISVFNKLNDSLNLANTKIELGRLLHFQARFDEAISIYIEALPIFKSTGNKNSEAKTHNYLGLLYKFIGQYEKAIEHYEQALVLVRAINFKPGISACL